MTKVEATSEDKAAKSEFKATFEPNAKPQLKDPKSSVSAKDLQKDLDTTQDILASEPDTAL